MRPGRRLRERDRPAARAAQPGQRPLRRLPDELHVERDLRPPRPDGLRLVQRRPAGPALRWRRRVLPLARVRIPSQAVARVPGLPAPLAVLAPLPLGLLPRPPGLFRPDPLLRNSGFPNR
jgi:hypothetical protein